MPHSDSVPLEQDDQVWRHLIEAACASLCQDLEGWEIYWKSNGPGKIWIKDVPPPWRSVPHTVLYVRVQHGARHWQQCVALGDEERAWPVARFVWELLIPLLARLRWHMAHDQREDEPYAGPTVGH